MGQDQSLPISGVALNDEPVMASSAPNKREALERAAVLKPSTVARPFLSELHDQGSRRYQLKGHHDRGVEREEQPPTKKLRQAAYMGGNVAGNADEEWAAVMSERAHPEKRLTERIVTTRGPEQIDPADLDATGWSKREGKERKNARRGFS